MNKKNGFTLIELLAVLIVLSLIAVITVPVVLNILDNSKKDVSKNSAHRYVDAVNKYYVSNELNHVKQELPNGYKLVSELPSDFSVSGDEPTSDSWLKLENGEVIAYSLKFGDYVVTKYTHEDLVCLKGNVQENEEEREIRLAREAVSSKVDSYVKAALTANSSLSFEEAKTVAQMDDVVTDAADSGWVHFKKVNDAVVVMDYSLTYGDFIVDYSSFTDNNYESTFVSTQRNRPIFAGNTVYIGDEGFYVMSVDNGVATMLANNCLIDDNGIWRQVTAEEGVTMCNTMSFSSSKYWYDTVNKTLKAEYAKDINGNTASYSGNPYPYVYYVVENSGDSNNISDIVNSYVSTFTSRLSHGVTGRLMTYEEATELDSDIKNILRFYWIGNACDNSQIFGVNANGDLKELSYSNSTRIRPVIIVNAEDLQ